MMNDLAKRLIYRHESEKGVVPASLKRLSEVRASALGQRAYIIGTGPSLNAIDLSKVRDGLVLLLNRAYVKMDEFGKCPDGIVVGDQAAMNDYGCDIPFADFRFAFVSNAIDHAAVPQNAIRYARWRRPYVHQGFFQFNGTKPLYTGHSVLFPAMQLCAHFRVREMVLCGIDLNFSPGRLHFYNSTSLEMERSESTSKPNALLMRKSLTQAVKLLKGRSNIGVFDATPNVSSLGLPKIQL
jgi:hypothetical protein